MEIKFPLNTKETLIDYGDIVLIVKDEAGQNINEFYFVNSGTGSHIILSKINGHGYWSSYKSIADLNEAMLTVKYKLFSSQDYLISLVEKKS